MENIIIEMVEQANSSQDYELIEYARQIVERFAVTVNAPSNWRSIGEALAEKYRDNYWVYEQMRLYEYE